MMVKGGRNGASGQMYDVLVPRIQAAEAIGVSSVALERWQENGKLRPAKLHRTTGEAWYSTDQISEALARREEERVARSLSTADFRFIDLFAGIGGLRIGFDEAGGQSVFSSEIDRFACQTYAANFGEWPDGDITRTEIDEIPEHDILLGGFPCQPFSIAGVSKYGSLGWDHGFQHPTKGTLFFHVARIIAERQPPAFVLENVKNLMSHDRGKTWQVIRATLEDELGYHVYHRIIDAKAVVPQHRERIFIIGFRERVDFAWPDFIDEGLRVRDILDPNPDPKYTLSNHLWTYLQEYAEKHKRAGNGFGFGLVDLDGTTRTLSARYYKDGSEILIPQEGKNPRRLTPRECARLMGFPETFKIPVSDTQAYKQFGNAVVAKVGSHIARAVVEALQGVYPIRQEARQLQALETSD